jgi:small subunit ribosomal protein S8|tara:strand:+ start:5834 stop:6226 length:393 start_codon:yes stop_codon:yes gene_type:complete
MSIQDPIANLFSSIKNAQSRTKISVEVPSSNKKIDLVEVLQNEGYVKSYEVSGDKKPLLTIKLKYFEGQPVIKELKRISKPGLRLYSSHKDLPLVNGGLGMAIVSTNKGLMTDQQARDAEIGGEVICSVF